jgi:hypothetical protein
LFVSQAPCDACILQTAQEQIPRDCMFNHQAARPTARVRSNDMVMA